MLRKQPDTPNSRKNNPFGDSDEEISQASMQHNKRESRFQVHSQAKSPLHSDRSESSSSRHQEFTRSGASSSRSPKSERDELGSLDMMKTMRQPLNHNQFSKSIIQSVIYDT
jgi:hypothetical protein